jgi:hypothetical protein
MKEAFKKGIKVIGGGAIALGSSYSGTKELIQDIIELSKDSNETKIETKNDTNDKTNNEQSSSSNQIVSK